MKLKKTKCISLLIMLAMFTMVSVVRPVSVSGESNSTDPYERIRELEEQNQYLMDLLGEISVTPTPSPVPSPIGPAKLQIVSNKNISVVNGSARDIEITVRNLGSTGASSIYTTLNPTADAPFQLQLTQQTINSIAANSESKLNIRATTGADAKEGTYQVTISFQYKDRDDKIVTDSDTLSFKVTSTSTPPELVMDGFSTDGGALTAGSDFTLAANLANIGGSNATNVQVRVDGMGSETIYMAGGVNTSQYAAVGASGREPVKFEFTVSPRAKTGTYPLTFVVKYKDSTGKEYERSYIYYATVNQAGASGNRAVLQITGMTAPEGSYAPGEIFTIGMEVVNTGSHAANNVRVVASGGADDAIVPHSSNTIVIPSLAVGERRYMEFIFAATSKAKSQNYALSFKAEYETGALGTDGNAEKITFEQYAGVNIVTESANTKSAHVVIDAMAGPSGEFAPTHLFVVYLSLKNTGEYAGKNIRVTAVTDTDGAIVPMSSNTISISSIDVGASSDIEFSFAPTAKAKTQSYTVEFKVEYDTGVRDSSGAMIKESFQQFCGVNVRNDDPQPTPTPMPVDDKRLSKPRIIIDSYTLDPIIVKAGQEFDLTLVLRNTHDNKAITNIKAVLTPAESTSTTAGAKGSVFIPVHGSNTFYINRIEPNATAEKTFRMYTIPDAEPRNYTITVSFKYQDDELYDHEETEIIGITVKQTTRVSTGNYTIPDESYVGSPIYLYFNIMNTGKSTLNNLTVKVEGEFDTTKSFNYFGSVNKNSSVYYDGEFTPTVEGQQTGKIVLTYEDEVGEVTIVEREFSINVIDMSSMMQDADMGFDMEFSPVIPEESGSTLDKIINTVTEKAKEYAEMPVAWGIAAAVVIVLLMIRGKIKKRKKVKYDD